MHQDFLDYGMSERGMHKIYSGKDKNNDSAIVISTWQSIYKLPKKWFEQFQDRHRKREKSRGPEKEGIRILTCKGECLKYKAKSAKRAEKRYRPGVVKCITCEIYMEYDGLLCPCCRFHVRHRARAASSHNKEAYARY